MADTLAQVDGRRAGPGTSGCWPGSTTARGPRRQRGAPGPPRPASIAVTYAMVFTLVAFDGIMALQPHWFSNLLGGFYFMGSFLGAHMLLALLAMYRRHPDRRLEPDFSPKQRHDLGKLCFGFTVFWAYLMWAQFLVIWYGNLPEETGFVFARLWGAWLPDRPRRLPRDVPDSRSSACSRRLAEEVRRHAGALRHHLAVALWLERYLLVMPSVTELDRPDLRPPGTRTDAAAGRPLLPGLRALRPALPDGLAAPRGDYRDGGTPPRGRGSLRS